MIIINTTFHVHTSVRIAFKKWLGEVYVKAAMSTGLFSNPRLVRILGGEDPQGTDWALQLETPQLTEAVRWHDETAMLLRDDMTARFGEKVLFFTTYLQTENLEPAD